MKKIAIAAAAVLIISLLIWLAYAKSKKNAEISQQGSLQLSPEDIESNAPASAEPAASLPGDNSSGFVSPLYRSAERVTKKKFGMYITPENSPVQAERFRGYHTGTDFEVFPEELKNDISAKAVCDGKIILKKYATGYGGVAIQSCQLENNPITVVYGHLKLESISANVGDNIKSGETIGILGGDHSVETDSERKHLHLGFHKGSAVNLRGYVQNQSELPLWIDPCLYVCDK